MPEIAQEQLLRMFDDIETTFAKRGKMGEYLPDFEVEVIEDKLNFYNGDDVSFDIAHHPKLMRKQSAVEFLYSRPNVFLRVVPYGLFSSIDTHFAAHYIKTFPSKGIAYVDYDLKDDRSEFEDAAEEDEEELVKTIQKYGFEVRYGEAPSFKKVKSKQEAQEPVSLGNLFS